ncbi:MAG: hypothetical protein OXQ89_10120, partial [Rhodospirillaceae bacterium]|nr:hypothetical protein [Rhodospirillaceae bacterium]MDE0361374.1 hypothetical protein [Rhodospirillaceae bacterium]
MRIPRLEGASVGWPITRSGISLFPIYIGCNDLPDIVTGASADLGISEMEDASVQSLKAYNPSSAPVLVLEGELFLGGKQNRTFNVSGLIPARSTLELPVTCIEQGRWNERRPFRRGNMHSPWNVRRQTQTGVADSMAQRGTRRGDQRRVWREVERTLRDARVNSPTASAADLEERISRNKSLANNIEELARLGPLPGQCGMAVAHGRWIAAIEIFGSDKLLKEHWGGLIRSHMLATPCCLSHYFGKYFSDYLGRA